MRARRISRFRALRFRKKKLIQRRKITRSRFRAKRRTLSRRPRRVFRRRRSRVIRTLALRPPPLLKIKTFTIQPYTFEWKIGWGNNDNTLQIYDILESICEMNPGTNAMRGFYDNVILNKVKFRMNKINFEKWMGAERRDKDNKNARPAHMTLMPNRGSFIRYKFTNTGKDVSHTTMTPIEMAGYKYKSLSSRSRLSKSYYPKCTKAIPQTETFWKSTVAKQSAECKGRLDTGAEKLMIGWGPLTWLPASTDADDYLHVRISCELSVTSHYTLSGRRSDLYNAN